MNIFELLIFLLICVGLALVGHLVSHRYGWLAGVVVAIPVLVLLMVGSFREAFKNSRKQ